MSDTSLFVLAGGRATRLKELSEELPKYLMPVGNQQAFADIHLQTVQSQGFRHVVLSIGYLGEKIKQHCGDGSKYGLSIEYVSDGDHPLGTGGALRAWAEQKSYNFKAVALTYGDTLLNLDVSALFESFSKSHNSQCLMTVFKNNVAGHQNNCEFVDESLVEYSKVHVRPHWRFIDYGFLLLKNSAIRSFSRTVPLDLSEPLEALSRERKVLGFQVSERFWEIGTKEALEEFKTRLDVKNLSK